MVIDKLFVFENLRNTERKTGHELSEYFEKKFGERLNIKYLSVKSKDAFFCGLKNICDCIDGGEKNIFVSLEFHGNQESISINCDTPQCEDVGWNEICPLLREINKKCKMSLNVLASTCFGAYLSMTIHMDQCAPLYRLIGPNGTYDWDRIFEANKAYISEVLDDKNLTIASENEDKYLTIYQQ